MFRVEGKPATFVLTATVTSNGVMEGEVSVSGDDGQTHDFDGSGSFSAVGSFPAGRNGSFCYDIDFVTERSHPTPSSYPASVAGSFTYSFSLSQP